MFVLAIFAASLAAAVTEEALEPGRPPREPRRAPVPPLPQATQAQVHEVEEKFLPLTAAEVEKVRADDPGALSDWKSAAARIPYLTEAVAMYYAMEDPNVPMKAKLTIAGALLYLISPVDVIPDEIPFVGQIDDAGALLGAMWEIYGEITQAHIEQAKSWLRAHGVDPKPLFALGKDFSEK